MDNEILKIEEVEVKPKVFYIRVDYYRGIQPFASISENEYDFIKGGDKIYKIEIPYKNKEQ